MSIRLTTWGAFVALGAFAACSGGSSTNPNPGTGLSLNVGQSANYLDSVPQNLNLSVAAGAQYLIAVLNTSADRTAAESFNLHGTGGPTHNLVANHGGVAAAHAAPRFFGAPQRQIHLPSAEGAAVHMAMLDGDRQIYRRIRENGGLTAIRARFRAGQQRLSSAAAVRAMTGPVPGKIDTTVGAKSRLFVRTAITGTCATADTVTARTVFASNRLIVLEDTASATHGTLDPFLISLANEYDATTYPEVVKNFGDPLLIDSVVGDSLAHLGKVAVLFSPVLNTTLHGVAGFVNPCDFLPNGTVLAGTPPDTVRSNDTEIFYGFVPDNVSPNGFKTAEWEPFIRSVSAHETKHVASFAQHINDNAASFETSWLEEATAQMSAEIWSRNFLPTTWKGNATYNQTVGCELKQSCPSYTGPITYSDSHLVFLYFFMSQLTAESVLGPATDAKYGGSWMFVRWTADQYASDEAAYFKSIIDDPTNTGLDNLSAHTTRPAKELMLNYYLALASNNIVAGFVPADIHLTEPSYNLRNIFLGISQLGNPNFNLPYPLVPLAVSTGTFDSPVTGLRGGGGAVFLLSSNGSGTQSISVQENGAPISSTSGLRLGIVRVQ